MQISRRFYLIISEIIHKIFELAEFILFLRLVLKFLGANPETLVVSLIYEMAGILISPFQFIFPDIYWPAGHLIEVTTISAMIGYWFALFILFQILRLFFKE